MGLYQRLTAQDGTKLSAHTFGAVMRLWASGDGTRAQVIEILGVSDDADTIADLDAIAASYSALPSNNTANVIKKAQWPDKLEGVAILCEAGKLTEAQAKGLLGF